MGTEISIDDLNKLPAKFANRFHVFVTQHYARILFSDNVLPGNDNFHTHIVVPLDDAKGISELILKLIKQIDDENKKIMSASDNPK